VRASSGWRVIRESPKPWNSRTGRPAGATAVLRRAVAHHELTARWIAETLERLD